MIFGNAAPKFQVSAVDILLDYAVIERDEIDYKTLLHESGLNRARSYITKPEHHIFVVLIHLHRYQDPKAKYDEIVQHLSVATCQLWRHRDGQAFQDTGSADADFIFKEYQSLYITTTDYADGLRLTFESAEAIDHSDFGDNWTFARALTSSVSNAWYLDPTSGLMVAAADTTTSRRLVAGRYKGTAIVIEGARTNLITHPSDFSNAGWVATDITKTNATTETLDPKGTSTASKLLTTAPGGDVKWTTGTPVGNDVAVVFWLKTATGIEGASLTLTGSGGGTSGAQAKTVTTDWQKFKMTDDTSAYTTNLEITIGISDNATAIYVWSSQMEDSAEFPSTIINPIATAAKTRALEKFTILSANTNLTKLKGTVSMWFKPYFDPTAHSGAVVLYEGGDSAGALADVHVRFYYLGTPDRFVLEVRGDNADTKRIDYTPDVSTGVTQDNWHHIVFTWDATVSNGGHIYVDGAELSTGSTNSAFNVSETGDTIAIGSELDSQSPAFGEYDELFIDPEVWTAEKVLAVFNMPNGLPRTLI